MLTYTHDAASRRTKVEDSSGGVLTSTYDDASRLTKREFGGASQTPLRIDLAYDNVHRATTITRYSDLAGITKVGSTITTYDNDDRITNRKDRDAGDAVFANYSAAVRVLTTRSWSSSVIWS